MNIKFSQISFFSLFILQSFLLKNSYSDEKGTELENKAVQAVISLPSIIPTGKIDSSCIQCKDMVDTGNSEDLFCKNFYDSICLNKDGSSKSEGSFAASGILLSGKLKEARDLASQAMGHKDFKDAAVSLLKKNGIELPSNLSDSQLSQLLQENNNLPYAKTPDEVAYPEVKKCEEIGVKDVLENNVVNLNKTVDGFKAQIQAANSRLAELAALDLPNYLTTEFSSKCSHLINEPENYPKDLNSELSIKCKSFPKIREEAANLYRNEDDPDYKIKVLAFVKKSQLPVEVKKPTETDLINPSNIEYNRYKEIANSLCNTLKNSLQNASQKQLAKFVTDMSKSRPIVEHMIGAYYGSERKNEATALLNEAKISIQKLLPRITQDSNKIKKISQGYDQLKLGWLANPSLDHYEKNPRTGLMSLKENDDPNDEMVFAFADSRLSYFTDINAFYTPLVKEGDKVTAVDTVHMMPYFLQTLDKGKYNFLSVVAHEAGHKIGPLVSAANGHNLKSEWSDLINCYKQNNSIKLTEVQKDETIADYVSSEVLADMIGKLPKEERRNAFIESMNDFCVFNDSSNSSYYLSTVNDHPEDIFRINGIYGSNPRLKEVAGCPATEGDFKNCALPKGTK